ncbi:3-isopropylmalate dehydratase small subunit [Buchnera aphidicola]
MSNVDTDAIIPKQFLQKIDKKGFGDSLFYNWRFLNNNPSIPDMQFVLNQPDYKKSSILITRNNFGCGSSREHAVWALLDYGFRVIIASDFADIFYSNSFNNNLLLITLPKNDINDIFNIIYNTPGIQSTINLQDNVFIIDNNKYNFKIDTLYRLCLLEGLDNIDLTLKNEKKISTYERLIPEFYNMKLTV